jgi:hypothetical protein
MLGEGAETDLSVPGFWTSGETGKTAFELGIWGKTQHFECLKSMKIHALWLNNPSS